MTTRCLTECSTMDEEVGGCRASVCSQLLENYMLADVERVAKHLPPLGSHYHQCYSSSKLTLELQLMVKSEVELQIIGRGILSCSKCSSKLTGEGTAQKPKKMVG